MSGDVKRTPAKEKGTTWQAMDKLKFQTTHFDPFCGLNANFWGLYLQGGPLPVINGIITCLSRVITPVAHLQGHL